MSVRVFTLMKNYGEASNDFTAVIYNLAQLSQL
jgi:hypothetical protein